MSVWSITCAATSRKVLRQHTPANWVDNVLTWELDPDNTNTVFLAEGGLAPYLGREPRVYRCPADNALSDIQRRAGWSQRVRSYSMNAMVGDAGEASAGGVNANNPDYVQFFTTSQFRDTAGIFVFIEEHPDSLNDGYFLDKPDDFEWIDLPASTHDGAATLSFADGHAEVHRWVCPSTRRPPQPDTGPLPFAPPEVETADLEWLTQRISVDR